MKPYYHAKISAQRFGGIPEDYMKIHNFMDSSKAHLADSRHRIFLHNSYGIWLAEQVCGNIVDGKRTSYITISDGRKIQIRDIAEQHVLDDLGYIPTMEECVRNVPIDGVVGGLNQERKFSIGGKTVTLRKIL